MNHTVTMPLSSCPETPLNVQFDVFYAPRVPTPPFLAHRVTETSDGVFHIESIGDNGYVSVSRTKQLSEAWYRLCSHLRMDV